MDGISTTSDSLDQTDEEILTYTVSDEALEASAGMEGEAVDTVMYLCNSGVWTCMGTRCPGYG
jgi:hypothetical protein